MGAEGMSDGLHVVLRQETPIPLDAAFYCAPGELLALVGPSGSGKSTILRCIAGLHRPRTGAVDCAGLSWFDDERGVNLSPQKRAVGFVLQHYALFPHLTAAENILAALSHRPAGSRKARAAELLALVRLSGLEDRCPAALSGGQQQRVALARALARDPAALLLDEPFSAVDQVTRRKLQWEMAQMRRRLNIPIVLVTHDLYEAAALADRMCILHRGRTLQSGPSAEILSRPRDALVAHLVDLRNVFEGRVVEHGADGKFTLIEWRGHRLEARRNEGFPPGAPVCWAIPPANVILHRRERPSRGERENPVEGVIVEFAVLGETANVVLREDGAAASPIAFSVPAHVARRNRLDVGERARVSLLAGAIHLMPWEDLSARDQW
jgi:molybdate transport system ATP-binding protein